MSAMNPMSRPSLREETACALCGRREYSVVATRDRNGRPLRTVMCDVCGLVWTNPRPSGDDIDRYYASFYRVDYKKSREPAVRKVLRGVLGAEERRRELLPVLRPGSRVLDVGCGAGEFVYLLRQHGLDASGIEPGEEYADFSRRGLRIPIQTATVDTAVVEPGSQDVVTMFHMLEHVADPRRILATVRGWLREPDGVLIVEVPNVDSTAQAPAHRFHFAHFYSFNAATLSALGESVGFSAVRCQATSDGGNVTCVFRRGAGEPRAVEGLPENVRGTREVLRRHTALRHYLRATPYARVLDRLARRRRENRLLRKLPSVDAVIAWAAGARDLGR
ncbi:MAG TPA: class I SAM-dependent methyltransferase [Vicinamibacterales bacterium]|nr:class I SAM-dependent methyltransferase [Vicinamibacterales bacterium]